MEKGAQQHLKPLDGWRGLSIVLVLCGHMLPLGPKFLELNAPVAAAGMAVFFILSGFLIVSMLWRGDTVHSFLVRRFFRIVPLAWLFLLIVLTAHAAPLKAWLANFLFYANLPPFYLDFTNGHFWSLCVEVQFYVLIAVIVAFAGRLGVLVVPFACLFVTVLRISYGVHSSIVTWWRIDEILAGGSLALVWANHRVLLARLPQWTPFIALPMLVLSAHPVSGPLNYLRPYIAALLVGATLDRKSDAFQKVLTGRQLKYLAEISYALYVIHPLTTAGWMDTGSSVVRYTKRLISIAATFFVAHLSTRFYEARWIALGRTLIPHAVSVNSYDVSSLHVKPTSRANT